MKPGQALSLLTAALLSIGISVGALWTAIAVDWRYKPCVVGETWTWTDDDWKRDAPAHSPLPRSGSALAYDAKHHNLVLFGGYGIASTDTGIFGEAVRDLNDTWLWDGSTWAKANPTSSPSPRRRAFMVFDPAANQLLLLGGASSTGRLSDTWIWKGSTWVLASDTFPALGALAGVVYDTGSGQVRAFARDGVASWAGSSWVTVNGAPGLGDVLDKYSGPVIHDSATHETLFVAEKTNAWDGAEWRSVGAPRAYIDDMAAAYDPLHREIVAFGGVLGAGLDSFPVSDTWTWNGQVWVQARPSMRPSERFGAAMAFDGSSGNLLLFGGDTCGSSLL